MTRSEVPNRSLEAEAALFARHLIGASPAPEVAARYAEACRRVFPSPPGPGDAALLAFVRRHSWAAGPLDAACGLLRPASPLRGRLLLMLALLETSPAHATFFLEPPRSRAALLSHLAGRGLLAMLKLAAGLPLLLVVSRGR